MSKRGNKILYSFSKYYITFVIVVFIIFFVAYAFLGYTLSKTEKSNNTPIFNIINGRENSYSKFNTEEIEKIGGYVEILDSDKNVIKTVGQVTGDKKDKYTEQELINAISMNNKEDEYNVLVNTLTNDAGENFTVLIRIPKNKVSLEVNLLKVPYSVGKHFYMLYLKVIVAAAGLAILSIVLYSIWTARRIEKPLEKIDEALGEIIKGDYQKKMDLQGNREFVIISDTINFLIDKLRNSEEENKKLQESKSKMLLDLSHDIKTPITTIRGFSAALYSGLIKEDDQKERYFKTIYNKSERVGELVDDLFEFVKLDQNNYNLVLEEVDLAELLRQIVVDFVDEIEEKNFKLEVNIPESVVNCSIDTKLFKRVIINLIENALKYNPSETEIKVELRETQEAIVIIVADSGIGIPEKLGETIFDPFVRGDESRKSDGGSGLGLAIAQKIIKGHGGEITLLSNTSEWKTIFHIRIEKNSK